MQLQLCTLTIPATAYLSVGLLVPVVVFWALWILRATDARRLGWIALGLLGWCGFLALFGLGEPLEHTRLLPLLAMPMVLPPALLVLGVTLRGPASFFGSLSLIALTLLQSFRLPLELFGLRGLVLGGAMPRLMSFEGGNLDILMGLSAPVMAALLASGSLASPRLVKLLSLWNITGLCLLANVLVRGLFSIPSSAQLWGFETPNVAVLSFPFTFIPGLFVMAALAGHAFSLRALYDRSAHRQLRARGA